jgi:chaperone required for assembly of F1-ATPase
VRDIFEDLYSDSPRNPMEAARAAMRPALRARFYTSAEVGDRDGSGTYPVLLDGKPVRTPARRALAAPTQALAAAIAAEWEAQREHVNPATMPLTRLANSIIDGVADKSAEVAAHVAEFLGSDLVFYRADAPQGLVARQAHYWDPILAWAREALGARFILVQGVTHASQPAEAIARARAAIPQDAWRLGAVHAATTLTGSALIALALAARNIDLGAAWTAAHVDEDWNMETWGRDELAMQRRDFRFAEMQAAATVLDLAP